MTRMADNDKHPALVAQGDANFPEWDELDATQRKVVLLSPYFNSIRHLCAFAELDPGAIERSRNNDPNFSSAILTARHSPELVMRRMNDALQGLVMYHLGDFLEKEGIPAPQRMKAMDMVLKLNAGSVNQGVNISNFINIPGARSEVEPVIDTTIAPQRRTREQRAAGVPRRERKPHSPKRIEAAK